MRIKSYIICLYFLFLFIIGYSFSFNLEKSIVFNQNFVLQKDILQDIISLDQENECMQNHLIEHINEDQIFLNSYEETSQKFAHGLSVQENKSSFDDFNTTQPLFIELSRKIFTTLEERQQFFAEIGIEYLNKTAFDYLPALELDPRKSEKYLANVQQHDFLTKFYGADIAAQRLVPLSIRWLGKNIGHGIFAEEDFFEGEFIGIYGGVVQERVLVKERDYAWAYPGKTLEGGRISLDAAKKGNELRLINDGKDFNCLVKYIIGNDGLWHICYIAAKNIKKNDQLLVSYGKAYWETRKYKYQNLINLE
jgi:hypothetical protein